MNADKMTTGKDSITVPIADAVALAIEHWRLSTAIAAGGANAGVAKHAARRIGDVLARWKIEAQSLDNRPFDAGLAARVVDTIVDPGTPADVEVVDETVSPLVLHNGVVIRPAEIIVRRGLHK